MQGNCTCGQIRYRLTSRPLFTHCCHCTWCQREADTAFALNAMIEADRVELLSGEPEHTTIPTASGKGQKIARCPACKIALWSNYAGAGEKIRFVRVGTLEDPTACPPDIHIFTTTKHPWVAIPDGAKSVPEFYRRSETWPAESLARFQALRG